MGTLPALMGEYADRPTLHVGEFASARFFEFEVQIACFLKIIFVQRIFDFFKMII